MIERLPKMIRVAKSLLRESGPVQPNTLSRSVKQHEYSTIAKSISKMAGLLPKGDPFRKIVWKRKKRS